MKGTFITFEGSEGCGKSTQSRLLLAFLKRKGYGVIFVREPGSTRIGEKIRKVLLDAKNDSLSPECEMLLYMAARAQIVEEIIKPALKDGKIVLCDRFLDSTLAYQGYGLGMDIRLITRLGALVTQGIVPDLTILLDVPLKKGLRYREASKDRIERRPLSYHGRVRRGYFTLARLAPGRIKIVKVAEDKFETQARIRRLALGIV
jgi:dTMP kinase